MKDVQLGNVLLCCPACRIAALAGVDGEIDALDDSNGPVTFRLADSSFVRAPKKLLKPKTADGDEYTVEVRRCSYTSCTEGKNGRPSILRPGAGLAGSGWVKVRLY